MSFLATDDFDPTPEQRENLTTLADYLAALPEDYDRLEMRTYFRGANVPGSSSVDVEAGPECGSCACAIGHGPAAGIPLGEEWYWYEYAQRVFGTCETSSEQGQFMFGARNVNCPRAAAERIRTVLSGEWSPNMVTQ